LKYKAAKAMGDAATSGGGVFGDGGASNGMGLGIGAGMGMMIPGMIYQTMAAGGQKVAPKEAEMQQVNCPECHGTVSVDSRFCSHCGHQMVVIKKCPRCDKNVTTSANFCPSCGLDMKAELHCAQCQTKLPPGTKYCFNCGTSVNVE
ncbi:MAG: hypothetical protein GTO40_20660, partial [Deltaproteobacteria bacterium]|nr:hypothetical protein [Deltaproteobacteria bacterium]